VLVLRSGHVQCWLAETPVRAAVAQPVTVTSACCGFEPLTVADCPVKCLVGLEAPRGNKGSYSGCKAAGA